MVRVPPRHDTPDQREPGEAFDAERGVCEEGREAGGWNGGGEGEGGREVRVLLAWRPSVVVQGVEVDSDGVVVKGDVEDVLEEGLGLPLSIVISKNVHKQNTYRFNEVLDIPWTQN